MKLNLWAEIKGQHLMVSSVHTDREGTIVGFTTFPDEPYGPFYSIWYEDLDKVRLYFKETADLRG